MKLVLLPLTLAISVALLASANAAETPVCPWRPAAQDVSSRVQRWEAVAEPFRDSASRRFRPAPPAPSGPSSPRSAVGFLASCYPDVRLGSKADLGFQSV